MSPGEKLRRAAIAWVEGYYQQPLDERDDHDRKGQRATRKLETAARAFAADSEEN
jgi:hypothetical protein